MDEKDFVVVLTETVERSKSNTHMINELKDEIKEIREDQKSIYKIATSVEVIANNMQNLQASVEDVKNGQEKLGQKMDNQIVEVRNEQKNLDAKIQAVDNKSKVDLLTYLKDNWYKLAFGAGGISGLVYFVQQLLK
jgi:predicted RNase H-like nuclease (RuvC/YqgF family)